MKTKIALCSLFVAMTASAEVQKVMDLPPEVWIGESVEILEASRAERNYEIPAGTVLVENATDVRAEVPLLVIDSPKITTDRYALVGKVFHVDVNEEGYLETWNEFPDGDRYFSKTLAEFGPMRWLAGSSMGFREFSLPFSMTTRPDVKPVRIEMNLVLPSTGKVYLRDVALVEFTGASGVTSQAGEWWGPQTAGKVGATFGVVGGLLGALIGCCGPLVANGKGRNLVTVLLSLMVVAGFVLTVFGLIAVFGNQPYHVYYPLLLTGGLEMVLGILLFVVMTRRFSQMELHKMKAMDVS